MGKFLTAVSESFVKLTATISKMRSLFLLLLTAFAVTIFLPAAGVYAIFLAVTAGVAASGYEIYSSIKKGKELQLLKAKDRDESREIAALIETLKQKQNENQLKSIEMAKLEHYHAAMKQFSFVLQAMQSRLAYSVHDKQTQIEISQAFSQIRQKFHAELKTSNSVESKIKFVEEATGNTLNLISRYTSAEDKAEYLKNNQLSYNQAFPKHPIKLSDSKLSPVPSVSISKSQLLKKSVSAGFGTALSVFGLGSSLTVAVASFILTPAAIIALPLATLMFTSLGLLGLSIGVAMATSAIHYKYVAPRDEKINQLKNQQLLGVKKMQINHLQQELEHAKNYKNNYKNNRNNITESITQEAVHINEHLAALALDNKTLQSKQIYRADQQFKIAHPNLVKHTAANSEEQTLVVGLSEHI